jgi:Toprim-like
VACVASMGTAVSPEQILAALELLGDRVDGKLIINLDGDDAGEAAAVRLCESVLPTMTGVSCVYIAQPPEHVKDVGEFLDGGDESATAEAYVKFLEEAAAPWLEWRVMRIIQQVLDARAKVETAVQVAQAAELGAMGDGDDDEDAYGPGGGVSQTSSLSEQMRQESLMFLDSMSGVSGSGDGGEEAAGDAQDSSEGRARRDENVRALSAKERQQRRAASLASTRASQDGENAEGDDASIGGCPVAVLDELGVFMSKALRGSPGVNVPWLVHRWADTLSGGSTKRVPLLYDAVMSHIVRHMSKWESTSPAHMIDLMPPPPWVIEELPKARQAKMMRSTGSAQEGKPMDIDVFMGDSRRRKESHKRMQLQETFLIPHVERRQSPASRQLRSKPRAAAEEIVLRAILWADANDRLDALEALLAVMIRVEEAGLFPFWTSASRAALFDYLVDVDGVMAVDEMAAECEQKEWWKVEVEMLFVPVDEFGDEELKSVRQLELMEPVLTVSQAATAVEEMARKVASGRAVDKLGDYMQAQLGDGDTDGAQVEPDQVRGMVDAISGLAFKSAAERKELDEAAIARDAEWEEERKMKILEDKLVRGELVPLDSRDSALAGDGGDAAVDEADAR